MEVFQKNTYLQLFTTEINGKNSLAAYMSECSKTVIPLRNNAMSKIVGPLGSRPMTTTLTKKQLHNSRTFFYTVIFYSTSILIKFGPSDIQKIIMRIFFHSLM